MELPIKSHTQLLNPIKNFIKPFIQTQIIDKPKFIMPLYQVEKMLHQHYVNMEALTITFEYYDQDHQIRLQTAEVMVESTIQLDRSIFLYDIENEQSFQLAIEQILTVSANAG